MPNSKLEFSRDTGGKLNPLSPTTINLIKPSFFLAWIYNSFNRLNPINWFNEFRDIEITIEESFIKKA